MNEKREPMISKEDRPTAIDYDAPISEWKYRDLVAVIQTQVEQRKYTPIPPEKEYFKPEKELYKPEKEIAKAEKEAFKPEKEMLKPEKELSKPEKEILPDELVENIAVRVVELLKEQGVFK